MASLLTEQNAPFSIQSASDMHSSIFKQFFFFVNTFGECIDR